MSTTKRFKCFTMHLNPSKEDDAIVIEWLKSLPKWAKSYTVRDLMIVQAKEWQQQQQQQETQHASATAATAG